MEIIVISQFGRSLSVSLSLSLCLSVSLCVCVIFLHVFFPTMSLPLDGPEHLRCVSWAQHLFITWRCLVQVFKVLFKPVWRAVGEVNLPATGGWIPERDPPEVLTSSSSSGSVDLSHYEKE